MAKKTKSKEQLLIENRLLRKSRTTEGVASVFNSLLKWGFLAFAVWNLRICMVAMAGEETIGNFSLNLISDFKLNEWAAYIVGGGGFGYGIAQRRKQKNTVERIQGRNEELERRIDPGRSSSKLTKRGETREEDR